MRKTVDGFKWVSVTITVASLVTVFWVWPAWNTGRQNWYCGNSQDSINTMFRNAYPPPGQNAPFEFTDSFMGAFMANEAANQMLTFVTDPADPWRYHIEWYLTPMTTVPMMGMVTYNLTIGRYRMGMMGLDPFFSAMGVGTPGSMNNRYVAMGDALPIKGAGDLMFMFSDMLGTTLMIMTEPSFSLTIPVANACYITSPLADPGYPGAGVSVPTLSQWGTLVLAILLPLLYPLVIKRRIRIGRS